MTGVTSKSFGRIASTSKQACQSLVFATWPLRQIETRLQRSPVPLTRKTSRDKAVDGGLDLGSQTFGPLCTAQRPRYATAPIEILHERRGVLPSSTHLKAVVIVERVRVGARVLSPGPCPCRPPVFTEAASGRRDQLRLIESYGIYPGSWRASSSKPSVLSRYKM